jgi:hypothetical protein
MRRLLSLLLALWLASPAFAQVVGGENLSNQAREVVLLAGVPHLPGATVDLNFATEQYYTAGATGPLVVSRASTKTCASSSGVWTTVGNNLPCVTNQGILIEESRTNAIRNNTMQGAVVGTPGTLPTYWTVNSSDGLTTNVVATGVNNGQNTVDLQFVGTTTGSAYQLFYEGSSSYIAATYGQTWSHSVSLAIVGGSTANISSIQIGQNENNSSGSYINGYTTPVTLTSSLQRFQYSRTLPTPTTAYLQPLFQINAPSSSAINITIRIGWPQLENNTLINSSVATGAQTITNSGTSGCTSGTYTVSGGTGTAATLTGVASGGVVTSLTTLTQGIYTVFPPSPAALTGTGCSGSPTVTLTPTNNASQGFATSPILTIGGQATRSADNVYINLIPRQIISMFGSGYPEAGSTYTAPQMIVGIRDASNYTAWNYKNQSVLQTTANLFTGSQNIYNFAGVNWLPGVYAKTKWLLYGGNLTSQFNFLSPVSAPLTGSISPNYLSIGQNPNGNYQFFDGYISRVAISSQSLLPY